MELDSKLSWKRYVLEKVRIAKFMFMHVRRAIGIRKTMGTLIKNYSVGLLLNYTAGTYILLLYVWARAIMDKSIASSLL